MEKKRFTDRDFYQEVINVFNELGRKEVVEKAEIKLQQVIDKANNKKATKRQEENLVLKEVVYEVLANFARYCTIAEIQGGDARLQTSEVTSQRIVALLGMLIDEGRVKRDTDKRLAVFCIA